MRSRVLILAVGFGLLGLSAGAEEPGLPADPEADFQERLSAARENPGQADWKALRRAFSKTRAYRPYAEEGLDTAPVEQELKNGERTAALHALDRVLDGHWVDPSAHDYAISVCERIDEPERARLHRIFLKRLMETILDGGDGQSFGEAWPVLSVREEYLVLGVFGLKKGKQALVEHEGHVYAVHTFENPGIGRELTVYFNVDVPRQWLREHGSGR